MTPTNIDSLRYAFPRAAQDRLNRFLWAVLLRFVLPVAIVAGAALWGAVQVGIIGA